MKGGVVGSKSEASARQKRAQCGAAASGRRGQAVQIARAKVAEASSEDKAVEEEVARAMQQGNGLVQATLEHLETAERSWDRFVELGGEVIDGYPSEVQVVKYMSKMSRAAAHVSRAARGAAQGRAEKCGSQLRR